MKVLVIGGTKYFGKVTVRKLLARGDDVTIFSRGNVRPEFWDDITHIQGDREQRDDFVDKLKDKEFDAVIDNLAFRVEDAQAVVQALQGRTGKYLVASTVSIYGAAGHFLEWRTLATQDRPRHLDEYIDLYAHCPMREDDVDLSTVSWEYDPDISEYAQGKRQIERYLSETPDFPSVVFRVPSVLGPEDPTLRFWWYLQRILDGREIILRDVGSNIFRTGFRDDVAQAYIDAMDSPNTANQTYNIGQDEILTMRRFLEVIAEQAGRPLNTVSIPGDDAEMFSDLPWNEILFDHYSRPPAYVMSIEKARRDFGLRNTPFAEWARQTVEWYRDHYDGEDSAFYDRRDDEVAFAQWWRDQYGRLMENAGKSRQDASRT